MPTGLPHQEAILPTDRETSDRNYVRGEILVPVGFGKTRVGGERVSPGTLPEDLGLTNEEANAIRKENEDRAWAAYMGRYNTNAQTSEIPDER